MIREKTVKGRKYFVVEIHVPGKGKRHVRPRDYGMGPIKTKADAKKLERLALTARDDAPKSDENCKAFAESWVEKAKQLRGWHENTYLHHVERLKPFVKEFGPKRVESLDQQKDALPFALKNRYCVPTLRTMYADAVRWKVASHNPFAQLGLDGSRGRKDIIVPTREDVEGLAAMALRVLEPGMGQEFAALIVWAAYTCMRPGELCSARFSKLEGDQYFVHKQWHTRLGKEMDPKHGSKGWIYVPDEARDAVLSKPRRLNDDLIFRTVRGKQFTDGSLNYYWRKVRDAWVAGLPETHPIAERKLEGNDVDLHEMRHFGASYMLHVLEIEPWIIAEQLRHTDGGKLVLELYGHPSRQNALDRIRRAYKGGTGETASQNVAGMGNRMGNSARKGA